MEKKDFVNYLALIEQDGDREKVLLFLLKKDIETLLSIKEIKGKCSYQNRIMPVVLKLDKKLEIIKFDDFIKISLSDMCINCFDIDIKTAFEKVECLDNDLDIYVSDYAYILDSLFRYEQEK